MIRKEFGNRCSNIKVDEFNNIEDQGRDTYIYRHIEITL